MKLEKKYGFACRSIAPVQRYKFQVIGKCFFNVLQLFSLKLIVPINLDDLFKTNVIADDFKYGE